MAAIRTFMAALVLLGTLKLSVSETYTVGDTSQWTVGVNYSDWTGTKTFYSGDTFVFQYNSQFHNVLQVTKPNYHSCNTSSPIATYTTGKDSITVKGKGHRFFICGFSGHCDAGQKVDIRILASSPASTPAASPPEASSSPVAPTTSAPVATAAPPPKAMNNTNSSPSNMELGFYQLVPFALVVAVNAMLGL